jgi:hypothetical protein
LIQVFIQLIEEVFEYIRSFSGELKRYFRADLRQFLGSGNETEYKSVNLGCIVSVLFGNDQIVADSISIL